MVSAPLAPLAPLACGCLGGSVCDGIPTGLQGVTQLARRPNSIVGQAPRLSVDEPRSLSGRQLNKRLEGDPSSATEALDLRTDSIMAHRDSYVLEDLYTPRKRVADGVEWKKCSDKGEWVADWSRECRHAQV